MYGVSFRESSTNNLLYFFWTMAMAALPWCWMDLACGWGQGCWGNASESNVSAKQPAPQKKKVLTPCPSVICSHFTLLSHCGLILAKRVELSSMNVLSPLNKTKNKKNKKMRARNKSWHLSPKSLHARKKPQTPAVVLIWNPGSLWSL